MTDSSTPTTYIYHHTHWDREWYWPFRAYQQRLLSVVDSILEGLASERFSCFCLDGQTVLLDDYLECRPHQREAIAEYANRGQLSLGPWFVMPDEFLVCGEALFRNLELGMADARHYGAPQNTQFTGYLPDTFGHTSDMPDILALSGVSSAIVWRGLVPSQSAFLWQSRSGFCLPSYHLKEGYFQMMCHDVDLSSEESATALVSLQEKLITVAGSTDVLMPIGGDHLGPITDEAALVVSNALPKAVTTTPEVFMNTVIQHGTHNWPVISGELMDNTEQFLLTGVWSSRMYLKQANRRLEHRLIHQLEPLIAINRLLGFTDIDVSHSMNIAWRTLMLNHPHDSICGCSVDSVHRANEVRFEEVDHLTQALLDTELEALRVHAVTEAKIDAPAQKAPPVFVNTSATKFTGVVSVELDAVPSTWKTDTLRWQSASSDSILMDAARITHQEVPLAHKTIERQQGWVWLESVPAYGYVCGDINPCPQDEAVHVSENILENNYIKLVATDDGLTITDKKTNRVYSQLHQMIDRVDVGDSYNFAPDPNYPDEQLELIDILPGESGALVGSLVLVYRWHHDDEDDQNHITTEVSLMAGSNQVRFETRFMNRRMNHKLQVLFPSASPITEVQAESHLGVVKRTYDPAYKEADHMPAQAFKELKTNTGAVQRFFSANHQAWFTEGLCEYEVSQWQEQSVIGITLMRAFGMLSVGDSGVRGAQAGPPLPVIEGQCLNREFVCRYGWQPVCDNDTSASLYESAHRFYGQVRHCPHRFSQVPADITSVETVETNSVSLMPLALPEGIVVQSCRYDNDTLTVRLSNVSDQAVRVDMGHCWQPDRVTLNPVMELTRVSAVEKLKTTETFMVSAQETVTVIQ